MKKQYTVIEENIRSRDDKDIKIYEFYTLFFAICKAKKIGKVISNKFHSQDRVFVKKGKVYYNPNNIQSEYFGISWSTIFRH